MGGLGGEKSSIEVGGGDGPKKKGIGQGKDAVVIVGAGVVVRAV